MATARRCPVCDGPVDGDWCSRCAAGLSPTAANEPESPALVRAYVLTSRVPPLPSAGPDVVDDIPRSRPNAAEAGDDDPPVRPSRVTIAGPVVDGRRADQRLSDAVRTVFLAAVPIGLLALLLVAVLVFEPGTRVQRSVDGGPPVPTDLVGSQLVGSQLVEPPTDITPTGSPTPSPTVSPSTSPPSPASRTSHRPVVPPPTTTPPTTTPPSDACGASYQTTNSWPNGFQGQVTVTAGSAAVTGWTVRWTLAGGQAITEIWNGTLTTTGSSVSVGNLSYNGALQPSASTTFGFLANGTPSSATLTCTSP